MGIRKLLLLFLLGLSLASGQETDPTAAGEPAGPETTSPEPSVDPQPADPGSEAPSSEPQNPAEPAAPQSAEQPPEEPVAPQPAEQPPAEPVAPQPAEQPPAEPVSEGAPSTSAEPTNPPGNPQPAKPPTAGSSECENCEGCCVNGKCLSPEECEKQGIEVPWVKGVPNWATVLACVGLFLLLTMLVSLILKYCCTKKDDIEDEWLRERLISDAIPKHMVKDEIWK